jgi:hypothetical protein
VSWPFDDVIRYRDRAGNALTLEEWAALIESDRSGTYKRVARTELGDGTYLSTVWLGLDHQFLPGGPPLIFETMRFEGELHTTKLRNPATGRLTVFNTHASREFPDPNSRDSVDQLRYSTEEEALESHARVVALIEARQEARMRRRREERGASRPSARSRAERRASRPPREGPYRQ